MLMHIIFYRENEDIIVNLIKIHVIKIIHACRLMLPQNKCLYFGNIIVMVNLQSNLIFFFLIQQLCKINIYTLCVWFKKKS